MKKNLLLILLGILIGMSIPFVRAEQTPDIKGGPVTLLRKMLVIIEHIEQTSQEVADNTKAIREKLGAK